MKKRVLSLFLALVLLLSVVPAVSAEGEYQLTYEKDADYFGPRIIITGCTGTLPEKLVIPEEIEGLPVRGFSQGSFQTAPIKELVLPKSIRVMTDEGFSGNQTLEAVSFSEGTESISFRAFADCTHLKEVHLSSTIRTIEHDVFSNTALVSVTIPEGVGYLEDRVFAGCSALEKVEFPSTLGYVGDRLFGEKAPEHLTVYGYMDTPIFEYCRNNNIPYIDTPTGERGENICEKEVDGVRYRINPAGKIASVVGCDPEKLAAILVIPDTVDGCSVTRLNHWSLYEIRCGGVILPDTINYIDSEAIVNYMGDLGDPLFICMPDNTVFIKDIFGGPNISYYYLPEGFAVAEGSTCNPELVFDVPCIGYEKHKAFIDPVRLITVDGVSESSLFLSNCGVFRRYGDEFTAIHLTNCEQMPSAIGDIPVTRIASTCKISAEQVVLGSYVRVVEDGVFVAYDKDKRLAIRSIYVPDSVEYLPADYFPEEDKVTMYGNSGSYAEKYAKEHHLLFVAIDKTPFSDVSESAWYFPYVRQIYLAGLMNGTSKTTFEPNGTTTRAMVVQVLYNLAGRDIGYYEIFKDVRYNDWYAKAVTWAYASGVCNGTSKTTFSPNDPVTREQLAAFLYRFTTLCGFACKERGDLNAFADRNQISDYAKDAIAWAVGAGIINGKSPTSVAPRSYATRAEIAAMLCRLLTYIGDSLPEE